MQEKLVTISNEMALHFTIYIFITFIAFKIKPGLGLNHKTARNYQSFHFYTTPHTCWRMSSPSINHISIIPVFFVHPMSILYPSILIGQFLTRTTSFLCQWHLHHINCIIILAHLPFWGPPILMFWTFLWCVITTCIVRFLRRVLAAFLWGSCFGESIFIGYLAIGSYCHFGRFSVRYALDFLLKHLLTCLEDF